MGTASTVVALAPVEEKKADKDCLLTAFVHFCRAPCANIKSHPIALALKHAGITLFHMDFLCMTAANIDSLQHVKSGALVPWELNFKHSWLSVIMNPTRNVESSTSLKLLQRSSRTSATLSAIPPKRLHPALGISSFRERMSFKLRQIGQAQGMRLQAFHEAHNWVDCKDTFMTTLEAQNLAHLVDPTHVVVDVDLHKAQQKHLHKVFGDNLLHHEAKPSQSLSFTRRPRTLPLFGRKCARPATNPFPLL